jgi:hypothetical protein
MKVKNNTDASQLRVNWKHVFLVGLHFVVFVCSALSQDFTTRVAVRALPQALLMIFDTAQGLGSDITIYTVTPSEARNSIILMFA